MSTDNEAAGRGRLLPTAEWVACPACGKETPVRLYERDAPLREKLIGLHAVSLCDACESEMGQLHDSCPETVILEHGVSGCTLGWHHAGRCEPFVLPPAVLAELMASRLAPPTTTNEGTEQ